MLNKEGLTKLERRIGHECKVWVVPTIHEKSVLSLRAVVVSIDGDVLSHQIDISPEEYYNGKFDAVITKFVYEADEYFTKVDIQKQIISRAVITQNQPLPSYLNISAQQKIDLRKAISKYLGTESWTKDDVDGHVKYVCYVDSGIKEYMYDVDVLIRYLPNEHGW